MNQTALYKQASQALNFAKDAFAIAPPTESDETMRYVFKALDAVIQAMKPEPVGQITVAEELDRR
jgi:hypothetical protein